MSVLRQENWLGQQRVDIPHLRAIESSICADFDVLAGRILTNLTPVVISGFDAIPTGAVGQPASSLQINVANATVMHSLATESGTIFWVPSTRAIEVLNASNTRLKGSFTASATNYIGFDLVRTADATTTDLVQFLNPLTNLETPKSVPLGRTLDYVIYVSTQDFSTTPNICPLAIVTTDASNNVLTLKDARNLYFRLGSGGSSANALSSYSWPGGRSELGTNADFNSGDKVIRSQFDWMDAIMTRLWEVGGGEYWYSATGWQNVQLLRNGTTVFVSTGDYFEWSGTNLHWRGLRAVFNNSTGWFNDIADQLTDNPGQTDLADGQCIYIDLDRTTNRTGGTSLVAVKGTTATVGNPIIPGSRMILAWRSGTLIFTRGNSYSVGAQFVVATTSAVGVVKLHAASLSPATPVVFSDGDKDAASGIVGLSANKVATIAALATSNASGITSTGDGTGAGGSFIGGSNGVGLFAQGNGTREGINTTGGGTLGTGIVAAGAVHAGVGSGVAGQFTGGGNSATSAETGTSGAGVVAKAASSALSPALVTQQASTTNIGAQQRAMRSDNYPGATVDYLGFRSGWVVEERMFGQMANQSGAGTTRSGIWRVDTTTNASAGWQAALVGGGAWAGGSLHNTCNSSRTNADSSVFTSPYFYNATHDLVTFDPKGIFDTQIWVAELVFAITGGTAGAAPPASVDYFIGWTSASIPSTPWSASSVSVAGIRFKQSSADGAWLAFTGDGTTQSTGALTTVPAMTIDTRHRLRIELHRANSPYGNCMRILLDGVLTTRTTNFPVVNGLGGDLAFQVGVWSTATVVSIGELTYSQVRINGYIGDDGPLVAGPTTSDV